MNALKNDGEKTEARVGWLEILAMFCACVAFSPLCVFFVMTLGQSPQLRDAVIVLITALGILSIEYNIRPHRPKFSMLSARWLLLGYIAIPSLRLFGDYVVLGVFTVLAGFSCALIALGLTLFDRRRYVYAAGGAFYAFMVLSFFTKAFDLPLRILAGRLSAFILSLFNDTVSLVSYGGEVAQIALRFAGRTFLVATECNGFGIILGCIILSIVAAIFRNDASWLKRVSIVFLSAIFAYIMNSLRIVTIIVLASFAVDSKYYHLMHETVGYVFFALSLIFVWLFSRKV